MVGIKLSSIGLFDLLGIPVSEFSKTPIFLDELGDWDLELLHAQLLETSGVEKITEVLDTFFLNKLKQKEDNHFNWAMSLLANSKGLLDVGTITQKMNIHYSTLERSFRKYSGMSPKTFQKVVRFRNNYTMFMQNPQGYLGNRMYLDFGYFDQNHFIKEFKYFMNTVPTRFMANNANFSTRVGDTHVLESAKFH